MESRINVLNKDYRTLDGKFDKIISIEMIEAVGYEYISDKQKIVLFADECGEYGGRITVIPKSWQLSRQVLRKGKKLTGS